MPADLTFDPTLAWRSINTIRTLSMDAVEKANSGHPGTPMSLAPAAYVLWTRFLKYNPANPHWPDRDRFVLSCGHASMLQYSLLHLTGFDLSIDDIRNFRQWGSRTPGHPERGHTAGIEVTTGPLGQGVGNAVGLAIAERYLAERFNRPGLPLVEHRIWGFASDGDIMEGVASEAASIAGHLKLGNLKLIYDDNHITIDGSTDLALTEDVGRRFEAYGWYVLHVEDGNDLIAIAAAMEAARRETARPTLIVMRTVIGNPAPTKQGTAAAHGSPLGAEEVKRTKEILGWDLPPFTVPEDVAAHMREALVRGKEAEAAWTALERKYAAAHPDLAREFAAWQRGELPAGWTEALPVFTPADGKLATRQANHRTLNALAPVVSNLLGGSADLAESTGTFIDDAGDFEPGRPGRNLHWGVREHGMGACLNGIAAHGGLRPYGSTFFIFFDYLKPALRLAALSRLPVIFIGTHDSVGLGEDGPTHQPIEQLAMLRAIPGLVTLRPADANETVEAWRVALERGDGPTAMVLTRQKLPVIDRKTHADASGVRRGGYVLAEPDGGDPQGAILATGSEVHVALEAAKQLAGEGIRARVVSLPSWELFETQPEEYRERVLPAGLEVRVSIEAAATLGWARYTGSRGAAIGIDRFGASAPGETALTNLGINAANVVQTFKRLLGRQ
ncbi:MAG: transketolase [Gemmatimonadales bacterium]